LAHRHHDRNDLTGEHKTGDVGQLIIATLFAVVWLVDSFLLNWTTFLNQSVASTIRIPSGIIVLIVSGYLARTSLKIVFGEVRETPGVIRKSVFNLVRHPMYLSEILLYLGLLLISLSLAGAIVWLMAIVFLHIISRHEERLLLERFGDDYARYKEEVPMWWPRFRKRG
jgi:protein-S-isoprenylcysteine O-methyltransferase Ste14